RPTLTSKERFTKNELGEWPDETGVLSDRDELVGHDETAGRVIPPNQRFGAERSTGREIHLRLVEDREFAPLERLAELLRQREAVAHCLLGSGLVPRNRKMLAPGGVQPA